MQRTLKRRLAIAVLLMELLQPAVALSAGNSCQMTAEDTIAGLGTQLTLTDCKGLGAAATVTISPPLGSPITQTVDVGVQGSASVFIAGKNTRIAGSYVVQAENLRTTFDVLPDAVSPAHSTLTDDGRTVTLVLMDQFRNPVSAHPVALIASTNATVTPLGKETDAAGTLAWTVDSQGTVTLTAYDILSGKTLESVTRGASALRADLTGTSAGAALTTNTTFGTLDHFALRLGKDGPVKANDFVSLTVLALDAQNRVVENFVGSLEFSSTDTEADFPTGTSFRPQDIGQRSFPLAFIFRTPGNQTLRVRAKDTPAVMGSLDIVVATPGDSGAGSIQILDPKPNSAVNTTDILLQGKAPSLINIVVLGGAQQATGETDAEGVFRVPVKLNPILHDQTLFVRSENKQYESEPLHLVLDMSGAIVNSIVIAPETGREGEQASITVTAEPSLPDVTATIGQQTITLKEESAGSYVSTFTAPVTGDYDVRVTAKDAAGNETKTLAKWHVGQHSMPQVQGVAAQSAPQSILVSWQPVDAASKPKTYRIYVAPATDPNNILYQLEADAQATSASIKGLAIGTEYVLSMTVVGENGDESPVRSEASKATPLGIAISAAPQDGSAVLSITTPASLTLAKYRVDIGTEAGNYPVHLLFEPAPQVKIPDLLNGILYHLRVTPILVNGTPMQELATTVDVTPSGSGFKPSAADPIPNWLSGTTSSQLGSPAISTHTPPDTSNSGIPTVALISALLCALCGGLLLRKRAKDRQSAHAFLSMMNMRYRS